MAATARVLRERLEAAFAPDIQIVEEVSRRRPEAPPIALSVVVPTFNERDNIEPLFTRLERVLDGLAWEAVFVDDGSTDGTVQIITALARRDRRARLIHRFGRRGLSTAVVEGMLSSTAETVAVIDADLQHDESILPQLFAAVEDGKCDLAVGSRYAQGGSIGEWSDTRASISRFATRLAEMVTRVELTDPMSGFFAVRRDKVLAAVPHLSGTGYKILLDLVASSPEPLRTNEISYRFRRREAGESKLDSLVAFEYLQLLLDKTVGRFIPTRFILFSMIGTIGLGVQLAVLGLALGLLLLPFTVAVTLATTVAMTCNFAFNNVLTYRDRRLHGWRFLTGLVKFYAVCSLGAAANVGVGTMVYGNQSWWLAGIAGAAVGAVWNYAVGGLVTWRTSK